MAAQNRAAILKYFYMKLRKLLILCLEILISGGALGQGKHDFTWILGIDPNIPELHSGGNYIDFKSGNLQSSYFSILGKMDSYSMISDHDGNLQFYTNGCQIISNNHEQMENGDEISPGSSHNYYCKETGYGSYLEYLGLLTLPYPGRDSQYALFHLKRFLNLEKCDLLYSVVDMNQNNGLGKVVQKNQFLIQDTLSLTISAVRHGNGRDWWVMVPKDTTEKYYFFLLDTAGIHGPFINQVDTNWFEEHWRNIYCGFSPDGSKFVRLGETDAPNFRVYDFDRCSGILSNPITLTLPDSDCYAAWAAFSPDSRYLYVTNRLIHLYQYDLQSSNIDSSRILIGEYDGNINEQGLSTKLFSMALAPDGKIYMSSSNAVRTLHVIHKPNEPGLGCDFRQHDKVLPANILFYMPNLPHFRVYDVPDSPCDTVGVDAPIISFWRDEQDSTLGPLGKHFYDLSYAHPVSWFWDFGDGATTVEQHPIYSFPGEGIYNVCLTVCNAIGDCHTLCREIAVSTVGVVETSDISKINVWPNPTSNEVNFEINCNGTLRVWPITGGNVEIFTLYEGLNSIGFNHFSSGLHFWEFTRSDGRRSVGKILKL